MGALEIVGPPLVTEVIRAGRIFLLRITDALEIVVHIGTRMAIRISEEAEEPQYISLALPVYVGNRSEYERCFLRRFECVCTMSNILGRENGPSMKLVGSHLVESLDVVGEETRLVARALRDQSLESFNAIADFRAESRKILESVVVEARQLEEFVVEFRCPLGKDPPTSIEGEWYLKIFAEVVFPNVATEGIVELASVPVRADVPLSANVAALCFVGNSASADWAAVRSVADSLRVGS